MAKRTNNLTLPAIAKIASMEELYGKGIGDYRSYLIKTVLEYYRDADTDLPFEEWAELEIMYTKMGV